MTGFASEKLENLVGIKWRNCWLQQFSHFPTIFSNSNFLRVIKSGDYVVRVLTHYHTISHSDIPYTVLLVTSNFSFSHNVFYPLWYLFSILNAPQMLSAICFNLSSGNGLIDITKAALIWKLPLYQLVLMSVAEMSAQGQHGMSGLPPSALGSEIHVLSYFSLYQI